LFVNGVLWVLRSGAHWRDLPERYGRWKTVHKRFSRWSRTGVWALRKIIADLGAEAVIPSNRTRKVLIAHDKQAYRARNRIECCFSKLKHFRRFATRYDRRTVQFLSFVHLAAIMIWMR
jgi:transposase